MIRTPQRESEGKIDMSFLPFLGIEKNEEIPLLGYSFP